jgi:hypothetical protein
MPFLISSEPAASRRPSSASTGRPGTRPKQSSMRRILRLSVSLPSPRAASGTAVSARGLSNRPGPKTAREGRGSAYINARAAVEDAKRPGAHHVGFTADSDLGAGVRSGLRAIVTMWSKRGAKAREAYDLAVTGMTQADMARRLGISQQAVSGRLSASMYRETEDLRREMIRWAQHLDSSDGLARTAGSS